MIAGVGWFFSLFTASCTEETRGAGGGYVPQGSVTEEARGESEKGREVGGEERGRERERVREGGGGGEREGEKLRRGERRRGGEERGRQR